MLVGLGDVVEPGLLQQSDRGVAQAGHDLGAVLHRAQALQHRGDQDSGETVPIGAGSSMFSSGTARQRLPQIMLVPPGSLRALECSGQVGAVLPWGSKRNRSGWEKSSGLL